MRELTCAELVEQVTDYLEGTVSGQAAVDFRAHLTICERCEGYLDQMRTTIRLLRCASSDQLTPEAQARIIALFGQR
jgi:predicted anti-sigma-YlaC factor YlaD